MSLHGIATGIPQTERIILSTTTPTVLLQASQNGNFIHSVYIAEATGTATDIVLDVYDGTTTFQLSGARTIGANGSLWLQIDQYLAFGSALRGTASAANRLHVHTTHSLPTN